MISRGGRPRTASDRWLNATAALPRRRSLRLALPGAQEPSPPNDWTKGVALDYDGPKCNGESASMQQQQFDRAAEDLGNAIHLEHVNVQVPDQRLATLFYVAGLGLTRDPYLMVSDTNMGQRRPKPVSFAER
jgi:hypothetical protein